jgi:uncharacterized membrane protein YdbT with pleckstrin-like domain
MAEENKKYEKAKQIARNKVAFIRHFITYIVVLAVLAAINNLTQMEYQWWLWIALFWGIGIIFNFLKAYVFRGGGLQSLEEQMVKREMERLGNEK